MTDKQAVLDALQRLPETASLDEITEELRIMASVRRGRADIAAGHTKPQEEAERLLESWATGYSNLSAYFHGKMLAGSPSSADGMTEVVP